MICCSFRIPVVLAVVGLVTGVTAGAGAYAHSGHHHRRSSKVTPAEFAAFQAARPAFERHCFRCHTTTGKKSKAKALQHLVMDHYPFGGHHASEIGGVVQKVLSSNGSSKITMPSDDPGAVAGEDLSAIMAWADAFNHSHAEPSNTAKESTHGH